MDRLYIAFLVTFISSISLAQNTNSLIGYGFDIRFIDPLDWAQSSKGVQLIKASGSPTLTEASSGKIAYHFVTTPYEFEEKLLSNQTRVQPYLATNSKAHFKPLSKDGSDKFLFVYSSKKVVIGKEMLTNVAQKSLDSAFVEDFRRLGRDITPLGFINRYGTHYAQEVTLGGVFLRRNSINVSDFIYSPYTKNDFQNAVIKDIRTKHTGAADTTPYIDSKESISFTQGGNKAALWPIQWEQTVQDNPKTIDARLIPITQVLRRAAIANVPDKEEKLDILERLITKAIDAINLLKHTPQKSNYYKKYSLQFKQEIQSIVKTSMGVDEERENTFTGDIFFGGFSKDEAMLRTAPVIDHGGLRLESLITDEELKLKKNLVITIKPEDIETGYVSVWDDTKKLFKGNGRNRLRVSGPPEAHTKYKEALRQVVTKTVTIETIDKDVYEIVYTLSLEKQKELIKNYEAPYNYTLDSEVLAAVSNGNIKRLDSLFSRNASTRASGIIKAIIINKHPDSLLNYVLDKGTIPTTQDLDLLFEKEHFNENKALILLERGAKPKNNMIYKAVAYKAAPVIYALFREGATTQNNDLAFALKTKYYPTIKAIMSEPYEAFTATAQELLLAAKNNDTNLAQKFVSLNATADASILDITLQQENDSLTNTIVPVTEPSNEALVVVAKANNTKLFSYFIAQNAQLKNNEAVNIATDNGNTTILDLALKNGGDAGKALSYAIKEDNKAAIKVSLENDAVPDEVFAYAAQKNDQELFNETLSVYNGNPEIALNQAVKNNVLPMAQSALTNPSIDINTSKVVPLAVSNENLEMVKLLVENKANPSSGMTSAIETENIPITEYLLSKGAQSKDPNYIKEAVRKENMELSKVLIEQGNAEVEDAIVEAALSGNFEITQFLLEKGASAKEALEQLINTKNQDIILLLLENINGPIDPDFLLSSARKGNEKVVSKLLEYKLDPSSSIGNAILYRHPEVLQLLLEYGGTPTLDHYKIALEINFLKGVDILLQKGDFSSTTIFKDALSPLHIVVASWEESNDESMMALLLDKGGAINAVNEKGETPLHLAARVHSDEIALPEFLLKHGADPLIKNKQGKTAMDYASDKKVKMLLKKASKNK